MVALSPPVCDFGRQASPFSLRGVDDELHTLDSVRGSNGLLVMFICNHCPYVMAVLDRIVRDTDDLQDYGIGSVAIMSNDVQAYPDDSFANMKHLAQRARFSFPYLYDANQSVARAYDAVCTPDFFGFNRGLQLQYRGRLDASGMRPVSPDVPRELFMAMRQIAETGRGPEKQIASIGCSIKWKSA